MHPVCILLCDHSFMTLTQRARMFSEEEKRQKADGRSLKRGFVEGGEGLVNKCH